jgi:integrase
MIRALEEEGLVEPGLTFHGLRHTVAALLAERGVSTADIAAVLGQKSSKTAAHYADRADRSRRARAAIKTLRPLRSTKK